MLFSRTKKYVGLFLALSIVFGCLIFNPEDVKADTGIVLGRTYSVNEQDYIHQFEEYCAAYKFVPDSDGYYLFSGTIDLKPCYFDEWGENRNLIPYGYRYVQPKEEFEFFNLPDMFGQDLKKVYYLEGGQEYYFRHSWYDSYNFETGEFCLRKINDYFAVSCDAYSFAQKGDTFNGYINTEATVTFDSFTCNWYSFKYGLIKVDHNPNSICTCISDDYFNDEDYQNRIEQVPIYCEVEIVYGGKTYTYSFYDFYITPYANNLDTAVWAEPSYVADEYVSNLDGSGYYFTVSAGTLDRHCTITYEWYKSDDLGETYQLIPGKTGYQISLNDLGDPVIEDSDDEAVWWQYKDRPVKCVVKFDNGNEVAYRTVNFLAFYGIDNLFDGNTIMTANYGDVITVHVNGSFIEPLKSKGFTYEYQWCYEIQDENGWDEYQLGTSKTVTIDTSMLPVYHNSEGDYSEFYCRSYPYYNGRPYSGHGNLYCRFFVFYTDRTTPDTSGVAINATNFPDSNFRKYVSDYIDQNKSGYLNDYEIEKIKALDLSGRNISDLTGISYLSDLGILYCNNNNLKTLDLSGNANLFHVSCDSNQLTSIDLSNCRNLYTLYIQDNNLTSVNLDNCPYLKHAYEYGPQTMKRNGHKYYGLFNKESTLDYDIICGIEMDTTTTVVNATPFNQGAEGMWISRHPEDIKAKIGDIAKFEIEVEGENLTYQWQYQNPGSDLWLNINSGRTDTLTFDVSAKDDGCKFRCKVSDGTSVIDSEYATLTVEKGITITTQPVDYIGLDGSTAKFSIEAEGDDLSYQWQLKKGSSWADLSSGGATTSTMSIKVDTTKNGKVYRCVVTDANGNEAISNEVSITVKEPAIKITKQPWNFYVNEGSTVKFSVEAEGEGLTYQWQLKKGKTWANLTSGGATTPEMTIKVDASKNGKTYRCLITDANGEELASREAGITVREPSITIVKYPSSYVGTEGSTATFNVEAEGEGLTYQWQLKKGSKWADLTSGGATTDTMTIKVDYSKDGKVYRCLIKASDGSQVVTNEVSITVKEPDISIISQPREIQLAMEGGKKELSVVANGEGLTYQWQLKKGNKWADLTSGGATTDTLTLKIDSGKDGKVYRCLITNAAGEQLATRSITIRVIQPNASAPVNSSCPAEEPVASAEPEKAEEQSAAEASVDSVEPAVVNEAPAEAPVEVNEPIQAPAPVEVAEPAAAEAPAVQADAAE